jgi:hypothetical protein
LHFATYEMVGVGVVAPAVVEAVLVQLRQETEAWRIVDEIVGSMGRAEATMMVPHLLGWSRDTG